MAAAATAGTVGFSGVGTIRARVPARVAAAVPVTMWTAALLLLNLLDGLFTVTWVELDVAWEANPLMRIALQGSPALFMMSKMMLVQVGTWLLAIHSHARAARAALVGGCLLYAAIVAWHLSFLARVTLP